MILSGLYAKRMEPITQGLSSYVESLYAAESFSVAFDALHKEALSLGYDGVLYTYIPQALINSKFGGQPVYEVSHDFNPGYLAHYADARFDKHDPLIKAVVDGVSEPIDWWGSVCSRYQDADEVSRDVMETSRQYGINNGLTVPLMSGAQGISGASFITEESRSFDQLKDQSLDALVLRTKLFHGLVASNALYLGQFMRPLLASLSSTEIKFLSGLASGKSPAQISAELNKSVKYLEQVMLKIRRKLSGVSPEEQPLLNRNQVLYYAGLMNILGHAD